MKHAYLKIGVLMSVFILIVSPISAIGDLGDEELLYVCGGDEETMIF